MSKTAECPYSRLASRFLLLKAPALTNAVTCHLKLAERTSHLDRDKVSACCKAGERLAAQMEDPQRHAFFQDEKRMIE